MVSRTLIGMLLVIAFVATDVGGQQDKRRRATTRNYPPKFAGAHVETYKKIGDVELKIYRFDPAEHQPTDPSRSTSKRHAGCEKDWVTIPNESARRTTCGKGLRQPLSSSAPTIGCWRARVFCNGG
jgi:hypothetical protein